MAGNFSVGGIIIPIIVVQGKGSAAAIKKISAQINTATNSLQKHKKESKAVSTVYVTQAKTAGLLGMKTKTLSVSMNTAAKGTRATRVEMKKMGATGAQLGRTFKVVTKTILKDGKGMQGMFANVNQSLNNLRWTMVNFTFAVGALAAIASPFVALAKDAMEYEKVLKKVQAVSGITETAGGKPVAKAIVEKKAGRPFTKVEGAEAVLEFTRAGMSADDAIDALSSTMDLAQISTMGLADSTKFLTQTMYQFGIEAEDVAAIADVVSSAADSSRADIQGMADGLKYAGAIAGSMGQSFEDTAAALAILSNAGLNAGMSGTSLRRILTSLSDPSKQAKEVMQSLGISISNADASIKSIITIMEELHRATKDMTEASRQEILGKMFSLRAMAGVAGMLKQIEKADGDITSFARSVERSGSAFTKAMIVGYSATDQWTIAVEGFKDEFLDTSKAISDVAIEGMVDAMKDLGSVLNNVLGPIPNIIRGIKTSFVGFAIAIGVVGIAFKAATVALTTYNAALAVGKTATAAFTIAQKALMASIGVGLFVLLATALVGATFWLIGAVKGADTLGDSTKSLAEDTGALIKKQQEFEALDGFGAVLDNLQKSESYVGFLGRVIGTDTAEKASEVADEITVIETKAIMAADAVKLAREELANATGEAKDMAEVSYALALSEWKNLEDLSLNRKIDLKELIGLTDEVGKTSVKSVREQIAAMEGLRISIDNLEADTTIDELLGIGKAYETSNKLTSELTEIAAIMKEIDVLKGASATGEGVFGIDSSVFEDINKVKVSIDGEIASIIKAETAIKELNITRIEQEIQLRKDKAALDAANEALSRHKARIKEVQSEIDKLIKRRFVNETQTINLINKAENWLKKQKLAQMGVADAQTFINQALTESLGGFDAMFGRINNINNAMASNAGSFSAWQETIKQAIRAEVEAGESLQSDVGDRVKTWQTMLQGISTFKEGGQQKDPMEDYLSKLQLASDVHFGGMRDDVSNFVRENEDISQGVSGSAQEVIAQLAPLYVELNTLTAQLPPLEEAVKTAQLQYDLSSAALAITTARITELGDEITTSVLAIRTAIQDFTDYAKTIMGDTGEEGGKDLEAIKKGAEDFKTPSTAALDIKTEERGYLSRVMLNIQEIIMPKAFEKGTGAKARGRVEAFTSLPSEEDQPELYQAYKTVRSGRLYNTATGDTIKKFNMQEVGTEEQAALILSPDKINELGVKIGEQWDTSKMIETSELVQAENNEKTQQLIDELLLQTPYLQSISENTLNAKTAGQTSSTPYGVSDFMQIS